MKIKDGVCQKTYRVKKISLPKEAIQRLGHVGIYVGARLQIERKGKAGKPSLLFVCGNFIMMRAEDLEQIEIEEI